LYLIYIINKMRHKIKVRFLVVHTFYTSNYARNTDRIKIFKNI
jgi:hypothetical protein